MLTEFLLMKKCLKPVFLLFDKLDAFDKLISKIYNNNKYNYNKEIVEK